jgi:hypothetical protein
MLLLARGTVVITARIIITVSTGLYCNQEHFSWPVKVIP